MHRTTFPTSLRVQSVVAFIATFSAIFQWPWSNWSFAVFHNRPTDHRRHRITRASRHERTMMMAITIDSFSPWMDLLLRLQQVSNDDFKDTHNWNDALFYYLIRELFLDRDTEKSIKLFHLDLSSRGGGGGGIGIKSDARPHACTCSMSSTGVNKKLRIDAYE